jgi:uncharacterized DUF497 family protein
LPVEVSTMAPVRYEWDEAKRVGNLAKHRIDFNAAPGFDWSLAIIRPDERFSHGEDRFIAHGPIDGRLYVLVYTLRDDCIRIISFRKANRREQAAYAPAILARLARG